MSKIRVHQVRYHRNGVAGEGFHAVAFSEGRHPHKTDFLAAVFDEPGRVAVLSPSPGNVEARWRGDHYEAELRAAIARADEDGSAYTRA